MAFRKLDSVAPFNSTASAELLEFYENELNQKIVRQAAEPSHRTFAASSFRCDRRSWFRLRGVQPDELKQPDKGLDFISRIGTACHEIIQSDLREFLKEDWIDVCTYLKSINFSYEYTAKQSSNKLETQIEIARPPIRFACDGIIRWKDKLTLLEIKTCEYASWQDLTFAKAEHIDQAMLYATLLNLNDVLFLYQDRWYGDLKCYSLSVSLAQQDEIKHRLEYVLDMVDKNLAPEGLPKGDKWCSPNYCPYHKKCKEYGR